jgi:peptidoglycan hydrolase-like protein with peptidoglycan-binding domain
MARVTQLALILITALLAACTPATTSPNPTAVVVAPTSAPPTAEPPTVEAPTVEPTVTEPTEVAAPPLERTLQLSDPRLTGDDVTALQDRLLNLGYSVGEVDGIFGPQTELAVTAFQVFNNLDVDGIVGPQTWAALYDPSTTGVPEVVPVVDASRRFLIGGVYEGDWFDAAVTATVLGDQAGYELYGPTGPFSSATGTLTRGMAEPMVPCDDLNLVEMDLPAGAGSLEDNDGIIGIGAGYNAAPRIAVQLTASEYSAFEEPLAAFLRTQGITEPEVLITRAVRVDLEGDGSEETLIEAHRNAVPDDRRNFGVAVGDYSIVAVVRSDGTTVIPVVGNYYLEAQEFAAPYTFTLLNTLDLDGDGTLEIVLDASYYEGGFTEAYTIFNNEAQFLFGAGCGV